MGGQFLPIFLLRGNALINSPSGKKFKAPPPGVWDSNPLNSPATGHHPLSKTPFKHGSHSADSEEFRDILITVH